MALLAVVAVLVLPGGHHEGCLTNSCEERVARAAHAVTRAKWAQVARPYRSWLAGVRWCESRGDYRAVDPSGTYTGAYQFHDASWHMVGGRGRALWAEPLEQDYRAVRLLHVQGVGAWPICGP